MFAPSHCSIAFRSPAQCYGDKQRRNFGCALVPCGAVTPMYLVETKGMRTPQVGNRSLECISACVSAKDQVCARHSSARTLARTPSQCHDGMMCRLRQSCDGFGCGSRLKWKCRPGGAGRCCSSGSPSALWPSSPHHPAARPAAPSPASCRGREGRRRHGRFSGRQRAYQRAPSQLSLPQGGA